MEPKISKFRALVEKKKLVFKERVLKELQKQRGNLQKNKFLGDLKKPSKKKP